MRHKAPCALSSLSQSRLEISEFNPVRVLKDLLPVEKVKVEARHNRTTNLHDGRLRPVLLRLPSGSPDGLGAHAAMEPFDATPLICRLKSIFPLSDQEKSALQSMRGTISTLDADQEVIQEGDRPSACCLILDGFTFSSKLTKSGKRQIVSLHVPGDIPDLQSLHLEVMGHRLATLAPSRLCFLQHETVHDLIRRCPRIGDALWRETLIDGAIFREWMLSLGQRDAYGRLAHLLCELYVRLHAVGR